MERTDLRLAGLESVVDHKPTSQDFAGTVMTGPERSVHTEFGADPDWVEVETNHLRGRNLYLPQSMLSDQRGVILVPLRKSLVEILVNDEAIDCGAHHFEDHVTVKEGGGHARVLMA